MQRQFTATVFIIEKGKTLLIFHRKLQKWLPPGGHVEPNETPAEAARREAREETGLDVTFIKQENFWIENWNATSFERPYLCLLEEIPPFGNQPAHQHVDFIYIARPTGGNLFKNPQEIEDIRWFTLKDIESLAPDQNIFSETIEILQKLLPQETPQKVPCI